MLASGRDDAMLRFGLGSAYYNEGKAEEAAIHLQACIEHDAGYSAAYKLLGRSLMQSGNNEEARTVFESGLPIAIQKGDKQTEKEINTFLKKLNRS